MTASIDVRTSIHSTTVAFWVQIKKRFAFRACSKLIVLEAVEDLLGLLPSGQSARLSTGVASCRDTACPCGQTLMFEQRPLYRFVAVAWGPSRKLFWIAATSRQLLGATSVACCCASSIGSAVRACCWALPPTTACWLGILGLGTWFLRRGRPARKLRLS